MINSATRLAQLSSEKRQYILLHLSTHLYESKEFNQLFNLIESIDWYKAKLDFDVSNVSYAQDVYIGIRAAQSQGLTGLPRVVAYSLLLANLGTLATAIPIEIFVQLIESGQHDLAEKYASIMSDPNQRIEIYKKLYQTRSDTILSQESILERAFEAINLVRSRSQRMLLYAALADLAKQNGNEQQAQEIRKTALMQIDRIRDDKSYEREAMSILYELKNIDDDLLKSAFYAAENVDNEQTRTYILKEIAIRMHPLAISKPEVACMYFHYTLASIRQRGRNSTLSYIGIIWQNLEAILEEIYIENLINLCNKVEILVGMPGNDWKNTISEQYQHEKGKTDMVSILFLTADPTNASRLRLGEESREIHEKLQLAKLRERFELHQRMSVRPADISQALLDIQPQIVHFSGHGTIEGALCFENQLGQIHPIDPDAISALFEQFADQVNCVILNACYSEKQAKAISQHIYYVIGMNQAIGDKAAIAFAIGFYQALGAGRTIEEAYRLGCVQIRLQGIPEHLTPILIEK